MEKAYLPQNINILYPTSQYLLKNSVTIDKKVYVPTQFWGRIKYSSPSNSFAVSFNEKSHNSVYKQSMWVKCASYGHWCILLGLLSFMLGFPLRLSCTDTCNRGFYRLNSASSQLNYVISFIKILSPMNDSHVNIDCFYLEIPSFLCTCIAGEAHSMPYD